MFENMVVSPRLCESLCLAAPAISSSHHPKSCCAWILANSCFSLIVDRFSHPRTLHFPPLGSGFLRVFPLFSDLYTRPSCFPPPNSPNSSAVLTSAPQPGCNNPAFLSSPSSRPCFSAFLNFFLCVSGLIGPPSDNLVNVALYLFFLSLSVTNERIKHY